MLKEFSEDLSSIKKIQSETKATITEIKKKKLQGNNSRMDNAEIQINDMEHKKAKNNKLEQEEEKRMQKNEDSVSSLWDNFKRYNINIIGVPDREEKEQEIGNLFEKIMRENFPNLVKEKDMEVQQAQSPKQDECKEAHSKPPHN